MAHFYTWRGHVCALCEANARIVVGPDVLRRCAPSKGYSPCAFCRKLSPPQLGIWTIRFLGLIMI